MSDYDVSLIICTRNRSKQLSECLSAVQQAVVHAGPTRVEIIVVDNNSTDETPAVLAEWIKKEALPLRAIRETKVGLSAARNAGLEAARGEMLAFTDDDCHLAPDYFTALASLYASFEGLLLIGGRIDLGDPRDLPMSIREDPTPEVLTNQVLGTFIAGCNMTFNRAAWRRIGPFDEMLGAGSPIKGGEDTDYVLRAQRAGVTVHYRPEIRVKHFHGRRTQAEAHALARGYTVGTGALIAKHPFSRMSKYLWWNARSAFFEMLGLKKNDDPNSLSSRRVLWATLVGMGLYWNSTWRRSFSRGA